MYWISALMATSSIHPALYAVSVRTVGISPRTSFSTVRYLPAVVLQVWDSASSRLRADFHRSTHIASVVPSKKPPLISQRRLDYIYRLISGNFFSSLAAAGGKGCQSKQAHRRRRRLGDGGNNSTIPYRNYSIISHITISKFYSQIRYVHIADILKQHQFRIIKL